MEQAASLTKGSKKALKRFAGEVVALRPVTQSDLPLLQAWDEDPAIIELMGRKFEGTNASEWLRSLGRKRSCRAWVIETLEGRLIGELELAELNWRTSSGELRICIGDKDYWGHGYGTDAIRVALAAAFTELGLHSIYLRVFATNLRAIRCYERLGFRKVGVLEPSERRQDPAAVVLMSLTRQRWNIRRSHSA
ncbi:MAG TPA: GNAT family protein [Symbiobacteriaceae bacterium]|nr:GNAT family protein [Symbiobacteriaceae bacterium]